MKRESVQKSGRERGTLPENTINEVANLQHFKERIKEGVL